MIQEGGLILSTPRQLKDMLNSIPDNLLEHAKFEVTYSSDIPAGTIQTGIYDDEGTKVLSIIASFNRV